MILKHWNRSTAYLHVGIALFVTVQILSSLNLDNAKLLRIHEISGMCLVLLITINWIWNFCCKSDRMLKHLYPWSREGIQVVINDLKDLLKKRFPPRGPRQGLPGFVEGFGLLAITGMALTGIPLLILYYLYGKHHPPFETIKDVHTFIAVFVWIYWIGHVSMAIITNMVEKGENK